MWSTFGLHLVVSTLYHCLNDAEHVYLEAAACHSSHHLFKLTEPDFIKYIYMFYWRDPEILKLFLKITCR